VCLYVILFVEQIITGDGNLVVIGDEHQREHDKTAGQRHDVAQVEGFLFAIVEAESEKVES
jgi:hypothetical protein